MTGWAAGKMRFFCLSAAMFAAIVGCTERVEEEAAAARAEAVYDSTIAVLAFGLGNSDCAKCLAYLEHDANIQRLEVALRGLPEDAGARMRRTLDAARAVREDYPFDSSSCERACRDLPR